MNQLLKNIHCVYGVNQDYTLIGIGRIRKDFGIYDPYWDDEGIFYEYVWTYNSL